MIRMNLSAKSSFTVVVVLLVVPRVDWNLTRLRSDCYTFHIHVDNKELPI